MRLGRACAFLLTLMVCAFPAHSADLRGHGGPVRAIVVDGAGEVATASFDSTLIRWDRTRGTATTVLRFHESAVNALIALPDGGLASAGEDRKIAIWGKDSLKPLHVLTGHDAPISALALSPDSAWIASASWDGTVRLWPLAGGEPRILEGHRGPVNAVVFLPDGTPVSAGYDGHVRIHAATQPHALEFGLPINALVRIDDQLIAATVDGQLHVMDWRSGKVRASLAVAEVPIVALAVSPDQKMLAAAGFRGALVLIEAVSQRIIRRLTGPAFPLWSLAFSHDNQEILTGGADRLVRRWIVATGEPVNPVIAAGEDQDIKGLESHRGGEIFKACRACHTLSAHNDHRAGPSLHKVIGRKIATAPDYVYSDALLRRDLIWTRETIAKLFEIGPNAMLPGTKMPEQKIIAPEDREALVDFIEKASERTMP